MDFHDVQDYADSSFSSAPWGWGRETLLQRVSKNRVPQLPWESFLASWNCGVQQCPCTATLPLCLCPPGSQIRGFSHFSLQISKLSSLKHPARQARVWVSAVLGLAAGASGGTRQSRAEPRGLCHWVIPGLLALGPHWSFFLPDELFQKVAEDYVSVAAFQVMTGVYFPSLSGDFL